VVSRGGVDFGFIVEVANKQPLRFISFDSISFDSVCASLNAIHHTTDNFQYLVVSVCRYGYRYRILRKRILSADLDSLRSLSACPPLVSLHSKHHTTPPTPHYTTLLDR
jgi:hypothetical protein